MKNQKLRLIVVVGKINKNIPDSEKVITIDSPLDITPEKLDWMRADLFYINRPAILNQEANWAKAIFRFTHDCGQVFIKNNNDYLTKALISNGFKFLNNRKLLGKDEPTEHKDYGADYLARWGNIDFMRNWRMAGEQLLSHIPSYTNINDVRILDVGCMNGYIMETLTRNGVKHIYGIDISSHLAFKSNVNNYHWPAITIGNFKDNIFPDKFFDMTIAMEVLEHVPPKETRQFIHELQRVTTDQGKILISTSEDWFADTTHINCRLRYDWLFRFCLEGLTPIGNQVIFPGFNNFVIRKETDHRKLALWKVFFILMYTIYSLPIIYHNYFKNPNIKIMRNMRKR